MPGQFLTEAERERLSSFPAEVLPDDVIASFTLADADRAFVLTHRGAANRLGVAVQLGALRYLGFGPGDLTRVPAAVVESVARQLAVPAAALAEYAARAHTRQDHWREVVDYLGFRDPTPGDLDALAAWLVERALEHDKPTLLFALAAQKLSADKLVRPGVTVLERLVVTARERAVRETYRRLAGVLTDPVKILLDGLLAPLASRRGTRLAWLRQGAVENSGRAIREEIDKLEFLRQAGVAAWDLSALTPNRLKFLAQLGAKSTNQALQRAGAARRYPPLVAFLHDALAEITDDVIEIFDRVLADAYSRAGRDLEEFRRGAARATNEKVVLFRDLARIVLDPTVSDPAVRAQIYRRLPPEKLRAAAAESDRLVRPLDDNYFDFLAQRYGYLRTFVPRLLDAFTFRSNLADDPLLEAVAVLRQLNQTGKRKVPDDAPAAFVPAKWQPYVREANGRTSRRYYEMCVLWQLRGALRAGDVWLEGSRRYADPASYLIPRERWPELRAEACRLMQVPADGTVRLHQRRAELAEHLAALDRALRRNDAVRVVNGNLVVSPLQADDVPASSTALQQLVADRLPRVDLTDLLIEVDGWTNFSAHFTHAGGGAPRTKNLLQHLYAAILTQACNFSLAEMAEIAELSYQRLAWSTTWYVRDDTLRPAIVALVNFQHRQPLGQRWGGGTLSSSDGQRFPVSVRSRTATALPRYFGYGRGLTYYTWTSDQFSQYGTKVIPSTVRDATYVLDEILGNETELAIGEHTTDTAGYTEVIFALFDLLGLQFAPRIRDVGDQRLFRLDRATSYANLDPVLTGTLNPDLFLQRWDDLLRLAGSLKLGWVTASLMIGKLHGYPRQNALARALQEYGRLVKTLFLLRYLENEQYRKRINGQLNKGEALHALRRFLFFANAGQIRRQQEEGQANQAACLNLLTNAIVTWNTVYTEAVLRQLRAEGTPCAETDVLHLSPARFEHINPYGRYRFNVDEGLGRDGLRPLRQPTEAQP